MGNPEEPLEPYSSRSNKRRERIEKAKAKSADRSARRAAWFARTAIGKWWNPKKEQLRQTKGGRVVLFMLGLGQIGALIVAAGFVLFGVTFVQDTYIYPADYNLTPAQEQEGYGRTVSSGYKSSSVDDVYYRYYTDMEYSFDPDCKKEQDWCIYAIARYKDCPEIYMEFTTKESDTAFSPILENLIAVKRATDGKSFRLGERITLGVVSKDPKANYGSVERIYCRG